MAIQPYLFFEGRAEEAAEFYRGAIGAEIQSLMRYKESPEPHPPGMLPAGSENKIMHMSLKIGDGVVMASDGMCSSNSSFKGFGLSLDAKDEAEAKKYFDALGAGGQVQMPLGKTFFSPSFGMVTDRFGVQWMVIVAE